MRTKQEVRDWLEKQIGQSLDNNCGVYKGQCVSLIKALFNFLGAVGYQIYMTVRVNDIMTKYPMSQIK